MSTTLADGYDKPVPHTYSIRPSTKRLLGRLKREARARGEKRAFTSTIIATAVEEYARKRTSQVERVTYDELNAEVTRARVKFPGNRLLLAALVEEVGELSRAYLQREGAERVRIEALQCACVAIRIAEEGDATFADVTDEEAQK
jgi:hypothetical protein